MPPKKKSFAKKSDAAARRDSMITRAVNRSKRIRDQKPINRRTERKQEEWEKGVTLAENLYINRLDEEQGRDFVESLRRSSREAEYIIGGARRDGKDGMWQFIVKPEWSQSDKKILEMFQEAVTNIKKNNYADDEDVIIIRMRTASKLQNIDERYERLRAYGNINSSKVLNRYELMPQRLLTKSITCAEECLFQLIIIQNGLELIDEDLCKDFDQDDPKAFDAYQNKVDQLFRDYGEQDLESLELLYRQCVLRRSQEEMQELQNGCLETIVEVINAQQDQDEAKFVFKCGIINFTEPAELDTFLQTNRSSDYCLIYYNNHVVVSSFDIVLLNQGHLQKELKVQIPDTYEIKPVKKYFSKEEAAEISRKRKRDFLSIGILGIDIETFRHEAYSDDVVGNQQCYCISAYGRIQVHGKNKKIEIVDVAQVFKGLDCIDQFVQHLIQIRALNLEDSKNSVENLVVAHNGCNFDYVFLIQKLIEKLVNIQIIGQLGSNMKQIKCAGLTFIDTLQFAKMSLKDIAQKFLPASDKKHELDESIAVTATQYGSLDQERLDKIYSYCLQDSKIVYVFAQKYFSQLYATAFRTKQGYQFLNKKYYMSGAQQSMSLYKQVFANQTLKGSSDKQLKIERESYRGGFTCAFKNRNKGAVISIDINSAYPASMCNEMPTTTSAKPEQHYSYGDGGYLSLKNIKLTNLYEITWDFDKATLYPGMIARLEGQLVQITSCDKPQWMWGVEIALALEQGAEVRYYQSIDYLTTKCFKEYIQEIYAQRQACKASGDTMGDHQAKLQLNSLYGKMGQKANGNTELGDYIKIVGRAHELGKNKKIVKDSIKILPIPSNNGVDLFQLQYDALYQDETQIGGLVRFASYVAALARTNLLRAMDVLGQDYMDKYSILYCDTDSIYIELKNVEIDRSLSAKDFIQSVQKSDDYKFLETLTCRDPKELVNLQDHTIFDKGLLKLQKDHPDISIGSFAVGDFTQYHNTKLLDENELGAFKVEKFIRDIVVVGQKSYKLDFADAQLNSFEQDIKIKGVRSKCKDQVSYELLDSQSRKLATNRFQEGCNISGQTSFVNHKLGVSVLENHKVVNSSFSKRAPKGSFLIGQVLETLPFKDIAQLKSSIKTRQQLLKQGQKSDKFKSHDSVLLSGLTKYTNTVKKETNILVQHRTQFARRYISEKFETLPLIISQSTFAETQMRYLQEKHTEWLQKLEPVNSDKEEREYLALCLTTIELSKLVAVDHGLTGNKILGYNFKNPNGFQSKLEIFRYGDILVKENPDSDTLIKISNYVSQLLQSSKSRRQDKYDIILETWQQNESKRPRYD